MQFLCQISLFRSSDSLFRRSLPAVLALGSPSLGHGRRSPTPIPHHFSSVRRISHLRYVASERRWKPGAYCQLPNANTQSSLFSNRSRRIAISGNARRICPGAPAPKLHDACRPSPIRGVSVFCYLRLRAHIYTAAQRRASGGLGNISRACSSAPA